jgi:hypothetical protein
MIAPQFSTGLLLATSEAAPAKLAPQGGKVETIMTL